MLEFQGGKITCPQQGKTGASSSPNCLPLGLMHLASALQRVEAASLFSRNNTVPGMHKCSTNVSSIN